MAWLAPDERKAANRQGHEKAHSAFRDGVRHCVTQYTPGMKRAVRAVYAR